MFKVHNKDTRTLLMTVIFSEHFETDNFQQVNVSWECAHLHFSLT